MSFLIYKDDISLPSSNNSEEEKLAKIKAYLGEGTVNKTKYTSNSIVKIISPTALIHSNKMILPKFKVNENNINDIDMKQISNRDKIQTLSSFKDNSNMFNEDEETKTSNTTIEILQSNKDNGDEKQKRVKLDRENLLKAFCYGMDPFENSIKEDSEQNEEQYELDYVSLKSKLNDIFNIKL